MVSWTSYYKFDFTINLQQSKLLRTLNYLSYNFSITRVFDIKFLFQL